VIKIARSQNKIPY